MKSRNGITRLDFPKTTAKTLRNIKQGTRNRRTRNFEVSKNDKYGKDYHLSKFSFYFLVRLFLVPCSIFLSVFVVKKLSNQELPGLPRQSYIPLCSNTVKFLLNISKSFLFLRPSSLYFRRNNSFHIALVSLVSFLTFKE